MAIVLAGGACVVGLAWLAGGRLQGPIAPIAMVASGNGVQQATLVIAALKSADIWFEARDVSAVPLSRGGDLFFTYEIWVKAEDLEGARAVLELDEGVEDEPVDDERYTRGDVRG